MATPSDVVAKRVREVRRRRGLTVAQLAQRCTELGMPGLTEQAIYNLEAGRADKRGRRRRAVTVDELVGLAHVLDVAPVHLLLPLDDTASYQVTATLSEPVPIAREWVRGYFPLAATDERIYFSSVPQSEWRRPSLTDEELYEDQLTQVEGRRASLERWRALRRRAKDAGLPEAERQKAREELEKRYRTYEREVRDDG
jgi:transcriptional regulator with XRE-family HTH domain